MALIKAKDLLLFSRNQSGEAKSFALATQCELSLSREFLEIAPAQDWAQYLPSRGEWKITSAHLLSTRFFDFDRPSLEDAMLTRLPIDVSFALRDASLSFAGEAYVSRLTYSAPHGSMATYFAELEGTSTLNIKTDGTY